MPPSGAFLLLSLFCLKTISVSWWTFHRFRTRSSKVPLPFSGFSALRLSISVLPRALCRSTFPGRRIRLQMIFIVCQTKYIIGLQRLIVNTYRPHSFNRMSVLSPFIYRSAGTSFCRIQNQAEQRSAWTGRLCGQGACWPFKYYNNLSYPWPLCPASF